MVRVRSLWKPQGGGGGGGGEVRDVQEKKIERICIYIYIYIYIYIFWHWDFWLANFFATLSSQAYQSIFTNMVKDDASIWSRLSHSTS